MVFTHLAWFTFLLTLMHQRRTEKRKKTSNTNFKTVPLELKRAEINIRTMWLAILSDIEPAKNKIASLCSSDLGTDATQKEGEKTLGDAEEVIYLTCINFHRLNLHLDHFHRAGPHVFHQTLTEFIVEPWDHRLFLHWEVKSCSLCLPASHNQANVNAHPTHSSYGWYAPILFFKYQDIYGK